MRLLKRDRSGELSLTRDIIDDSIPNYAVLSHTWGKDETEVTFADLEANDYEAKLGYEKIRFCGEQAVRDNLEYFWIDSCCIDKSNGPELQEAINSMFRWYQNAAKCYVHLSDVSYPTSSDIDTHDGLGWMPELFRSRWFTRGWTLQELLAPKSVEFFSKEGIRLGDKGSLERQISEITHIPIRALRTTSFTEFSIDELFSWQKSRRTTRKEDRAYSLLGVCGIYMSIIYGEGEESAFRRLRKEARDISTGISREDFELPFSLSNVPSTEHFTGREKELEVLSQALRGDGSRQVAVLQGLGGIGKTQLAVAYAKRHRNDYSAIFWLNSKERSSLERSYVEIAQRLLHNNPSDKFLSGVDLQGNPDKVIDAVRSWLDSPGNTRWLIIFNNYDNPAVPGNPDPAALSVHRFVPDSYQGSVLITTTSSEVKIGRQIRVKKLENIQDSLEILCKMSGRSDLTNDPNARSLAKVLDGLPLALASAGAYLNQTAVTCADYIRLYESSWMKLQQTTPEIDSYHDRTLYSTWQLSLDQMKKRGTNAAELLRFWAYFDNQDLWFELLRGTRSDDPAWIRELTEDQLSFTAALRVLTNYGLVDPQVQLDNHNESNGYSMHSCVHSWTINMLNQSWDASLATLATRLVASRISNKSTHVRWKVQNRMIQHVSRCSQHLLNGSYLGGNIEKICYKLGLFCLNHHNLGEAESLFTRTLTIEEEKLGQDHSNTLITIERLGRVYSKQGELAKAEAVLTQALERSEKILEDDHNVTLRLLKSLGGLYRKQHKLAEAEEMLNRAVIGREKTVGQDHFRTLSSVRGLGKLYLEQHRYEQAEALFTRALEACEKTKGQSRDTAYTIVCLGCLYEEQNRLAEAEEKFVLALESYEAILGPDHYVTKGAAQRLDNLRKRQIQPQGVDEA